MKIFLGLGLVIAATTTASADYVDMARAAETETPAVEYPAPGVGLEVVRWDEGGTLVRPDLAVGLGTSFALRIGNRCTNRILTNAVLLTASTAQRWRELEPWSRRAG